MATTASGVTIPGTSPTTTAATPIQDHWNNLGLSLNPLVIVPTASVTTRAALVTTRNAEGPTISASAPLRVHRADAPAGRELEVTTNGTTWATVVAGGGFVPLIVGYAAIDYSTVATAATVTFTAVTGRTYRISAGLIGTQITTAGVPTVKLLLDTVEQFRLATVTSYAASAIVYGTPVQHILVGDGASHTFTVSVQTSYGALRLAASGVNQLVVEQIA